MASNPRDFDMHTSEVSFTPTFDNLLAILENTVARRGPRPAFGIRGAGGDWRWVTWSEFAGLVDAFRAALADLGVERGDRVAVIANNRLEWAVGAFAVYGRAATYVPMYEAMLDKDWKYILEDCGAKVCLVAGEAIEKRVAALLPGLKLVNLDRDFDRLVEANRTRSVPPIRPAGADIAYFIYTSGTTGKPKGVRLSHANLASNVQAVNVVFPLSEEDRTLAFLPWAHVGGGSSELNGVVYTGASLAICERSDWILDSLPKVQPTVLMAVPRIWNKIYEGVNKQIAARPRIIQAVFHVALRGHAKRKKGEALSLGERLSGVIARRLIFSKVVARFGGRLKYACSGAAALSPEVATFIDGLGIPVYEGYGMTELSSLATVNPQGASRIGSVGTPLPGVTIKIDPAVAGDPSQGGEIIAYGHGLMAGYHNLPEETKSAFTEDGGLRTGDLGKFDADGYLYITGRVKEIYKLENGKYVSPVPLEERIGLSPFISQCMVHGQNKPFNVAILVPDMSTLAPWTEANGIDTKVLLTDPKVRALFEAELRKCEAEKGFERVEDFILVAEEFSVANDMLTPSLKVKRRVVGARYGAALEALYARRAAAAG
jgi:long-chain acyl-CoA synthetase